ncbi:DUF2514 domain-containing protein [Pseudomonas sp. JQ170]|uniref:DUF2514 domain-containing protein n=1 Tax=unclassified Pseudomonas TaxID=196821 RepID=UPI00264C96AE|nr:MULTISPECIES: DUF2514 domain-containing protein [unclassified Pseudomonas]MDN7143129.1 DUF2514 domain-containing protein [Pseudomonas sp. JQ170]WRO74374.1 DUF2514 domain-containing protein [Pseudomonas sp. 170C]
MSPWAGAAAGLVLLVSHWVAYEHGRSVELAKADQASAKRDSGDLLAEVIGERSARQQEHRSADAQQEARVKGHEERTMADAGADAVGQRLRSEAAQLAAAAVASGQAATRAAMVLSDLLARSDERAGAPAEAYDRARIAGQQCEREYDGMTVGKSVIN